MLVAIRLPRRFVSSLRSASLVLALFLAAEVSPRAAAATMRQVPGDIPTIQGAIGVSVDGDSIALADQLFNESIDFLGKNIVIFGTLGASFTTIHGDDTRPVVTFANGEGRGAVLRGVRIEHGLANVDAQFTGGGISVRDGASPTIIANIIEVNSAPAGGGIGCYQASPRVEGNVIQDNTAGSGGGIAIVGASTAEVVGNYFLRNTASADGGGADLFSAGTPRFERNYLRLNSAPGGSGGGIHMSGSSNPVLVDNLIFDNTALQGGGVSWLVLPPDAGPTVVANTIARNAAPLGSAIFAEGFDAATVVTGNILTSVDDSSAVFCSAEFDAAPPPFHSNLFWSGGGNPFGGVTGNLAGVSGNLVADPLFFDGPSGTLHLSAGSPAIDAGDDAAPELPAIDFDGLARIVDGNGDGQAHVDMGAFEAVFVRTNHAPVANAGGPYSGTAGVPIQLSGAASSDPDGDSLSYVWDFGDSTSGSGATPIHTYAAVGVYRVILAVSDGALGSTDSTSATVIAEPPTVLPALAFVDGGDRTTRLGSGRPATCVRIEPVNGDFTIGAVDLSSIVMRLASEPGGAEIPAASAENTGSDKNHDGVFEIEACFAKDDLRTLFAKISGRTNVPVTISGAVPGGATFSATLGLDVVGTSALGRVIVGPDGQVEMSLSGTGPIQVHVFDVSGRRLGIPIALGEGSAGERVVRFRLSESSGSSARSGLYFYRVVTPAGSFAGRLVYLQ
jgi:PKD repeat protein